MIGLMRTHDLASSLFTVLRSSLLVALPLIVIGTLALSGLEQEFSTLDLQRADQARTVLRSVDAAMNSAFREDLTQTLEQVEARYRQSGITTLPDMVYNGTLSFTYLRTTDHRIYPPDRGEQLPFAEEQRLHLAKPEFEQAWTDLNTQPDLRERLGVVRFTNGPSPFLCLLRTTDLMICVAHNPESLLRTIRTIMDRDVSLHWEVALVDPNGVSQSDISTTAQAILPLSSPLRGWRLEARPKPGDRERALHWMGTMSIIGPLVVSWLTMVWLFHRNQKSRQKEDKLRAETIAQLSHELRTPLANLTLYTELMRRKATDSAAIHGYCQIFDSEISRLGLLTENAIAFAKGAALDHHREDAIPDIILSNVLDRYSPLMQTAGCQIQFHADANNLVSLDRAALERITISLLDNARKYAAGSLVDVFTSLTKTMLSVRIHDHGPGVSPSIASNIFDPLTRGQHPSTDGFGLGLAEVRRLARLNGGDITLETSDYGACFLVTLEVSPPETEQSCVS
jgi:signal transduction histidine kinase